MKCGREYGGVRVPELGTCPAAIERGLDGMHGGRNAGRSCWVVAGTFCGGQVQGSFAKKYRNCGRCNFYIKVRMEEGVNFRMPMVLLHMKESRLVNPNPGLPESPSLSPEISDQVTSKEV